MKTLKLRGRGLLQSGDASSGSAAAAAAALNPAASMQGRTPYKTFQSVSQAGPSICIGAEAHFINPNIACRFAEPLSALNACTGTSIQLSRQCLTEDAEVSRLVN